VLEASRCRGGAAAEVDGEDIRALEFARPEEGAGILSRQVDVGGAAAGGGRPRVTGSRRRVSFRDNNREEA